MSEARVAVLRPSSLASSGVVLTGSVVKGFLDEAACALTGELSPSDAWATWFDPGDRVAIKVNCLGLPTNSAMGQALPRSIAAAGVPPSSIIVWDRSDRELQRAGYLLRRGGQNTQCFGTDSLSARGRGGYDATIATSGEIGSLYSRIVTDECDALVSAPVLKDHNLAGMSCALKNFFGAIHNPNKYHDNGCDPFIADVCAHSHIRDRLRLAVCDALRPQYNGGPPSRPRWQWEYGGFLMSTDPVALDCVALEILSLKREHAGMPPLESENRPVRYLLSAAERGLGQEDLERIEVVSIGLPWEDVS